MKRFGQKVESISVIRTRVTNGLGLCEKWIILEKRQCSGQSYTCTHACTHARTIGKQIRM